MNAGAWAVSSDHSPCTGEWCARGVHGWWWAVGGGRWLCFWAVGSGKSIVLLIRVNTMMKVTSRLNTIVYVVLFPVEVTVCAAHNFSLVLSDCYHLMAHFLQKAWWELRVDPRAQMRLIDCLNTWSALGMVNNATDGLYTAHIQLLIVL